MTNHTTEIVQLTDSPSAVQKNISPSLWQRAMRHIVHDKLTLVGAVIVLFLIFMALFASPISTNILHQDPDRTDPDQRLLPPFSPGHILGTDDVGRDYLSRLLFG